MPASVERSLRVTLAAALAAASLLLLAGCSLFGGNDDDPPREPLSFVTEGWAPLWVAGDSALVCYGDSSASGEARLRVARLDGSDARTLHEGPHNYDHTADASGLYIAFSTPEPTGGLRVVDLEGRLLAEHRGASAPSWIAPERYAFRDSGGALMMGTLGTDELSLLAASGLQPVGLASGGSVAWLGGSFAGGLLLYVADQPGEAGVVVANNIGLDAVWQPEGETIYASTLDGNQRIVRINAAGGSEPTLVAENAAKPSFGTTGRYLFHEVLSGGSISGVLRYDSQRGSSTTISNCWSPSAGSEGRALVERADGIYLLEP